MTSEWFRKNIRLMNKNTEVARFNGKLCDLEFTKPTEARVPYMTAEALRVTDRKKCPIFLSDENVPADKQLLLFNRWLKKRCISPKRRDIPKNLDYHREHETPHLFSLSDQYWLKYTETEQWEELNFFHHPYPTEFEDFCFSINRKYCRDFSKNAKLFYPIDTPNLCIGGITPKAWVRDGNDNILFKTELPDKSQTPLGEIMASRLLEQLSIIDFVRYEYGIYAYRICSKCNCFVDDCHEFIPMSDLYELYQYQKRNNIDNTSKTQPNEKEPGKQKQPELYNSLVSIVNKYDIRNGVTFLNRMIIADTIIMNSDRHLGNFGVLRNVETGKIEKFAPLFDFGNAFSLENIKEEIQKKEKSKRARPLFDESRVQQAFTGYFKGNMPKEIYTDLLKDIKNGYFWALNDEMTEILRKNILITDAKIREILKKAGQTRQKARNFNKENDNKDNIPNFFLN